MELEDLFNKIIEIYQPIHDFFNSMWVQIIIKSLIIYFFLIWIALIIWVTKDIVNRTNNIFMQVFSIILVTLLNVFGLILYLIVRPNKTLNQKYIEEIERKMLLDSISDYYVCINCGAKIEKDFNFCPNCGYSSKIICKQCGQKVLIDWKICPYCKKDVVLSLNNDIISDNNKKDLTMKKEQAKKHFVSIIKNLIKKK